MLDIIGYDDGDCSNAGCDNDDGDSGGDDDRVIFWMRIAAAITKVRTIL
jgi:hypothetical protein